MVRVLVMALWFVLACGSSSRSQPGPDGAVGQGPRSGLPEDTARSGLDAAGRDALCTWWGNVLGNGRTQHCEACTGNACTDYDVSVSTQDYCVAWLQGLTCAATVHDAEDCAFAQQPDLCASPPACSVFDAC